MNAIQIGKMMENIKADFIGMGRKWHKNDDSVMECIMSIYYQTVEIDFEEVKYLFTHYLQKGVVDFPTAMQMARKRLGK